MTRKAMTLTAAGIVIAVAVVLIRLTAKPSSVDLDDEATSLRRKLSSLCENFDFQLKEQVGGGVVRPINCKGPAGRSAHLRLFVFTDNDARDAWREDNLLSSVSHGASETSSHGDHWAVTSLSDEITAEAERRLQGG